MICGDDEANGYLIGLRALTVYSWGPGGGNRTYEIELLLVLAPEVENITVKIVDM